MIQVTFIRDNDNRIKEFEFTGHADFAPYGSDIVCAGVSAVAISAINGVKELANVDPTLEVDSENGGYLKCIVNFDQLDQEQENIVKILFENLNLAIVGMQQEYSEHIKIKINNI